MILAKTMLSNIYLIPNLLGEELPPLDIRHASNWKQPDYAEYLPERFAEAINEYDLSWIRDRYKSERFPIVLNRHIEIEKELEDTPRGDRRSALVHELYSLLNGLR